MLTLSSTSSAPALARKLFRVRPWPNAWRVHLSGALVEGHLWIPGAGKVRIGRGVRLVARAAAIELHAHLGGEIVIEDGVVIEDGTSIEATRSVRIGARTRIAPFCKIIDNHFHRTTGDRNERPDAAPVTIGADVTIGAHAVILPGAEIGERATVGPGSVVSQHLPAGATFPGTRAARLPAT